MTDTIDQALKNLKNIIAFQIWISTSKWLMNPESTTDDLEEIIHNIFYPEK